MIIISLRILIFFAAIAKSLMQIIGYAKHPEAVAVTLPIVFHTSIVMAVVRLFGGVLAFKKPFESFLALALVWLLHLIFFPLAAFLAGPSHIGPRFWSGFLISSASNIVLAVLAYLAWWLNEKQKKKQPL